MKTNHRQLTDRSMDIENEVSFWRPNSKKEKFIIRFERGRLLVYFSVAGLGESCIGYINPLGPVYNLIGKWETASWYKLNEQWPEIQKMYNRMRVKESKIRHN